MHAARATRPLVIATAAALLIAPAAQASSGAGSGGSAARSAAPPEGPGNSAADAGARPGPAPALDVRYPAYRAPEVAHGGTHDSPGVPARADLPRTGFEATTAWSRKGREVVAKLYPAAAFGHNASGWHPLDRTLTPEPGGGGALVASGMSRPFRFGTTASTLLSVDLQPGRVTLSAPALAVGRPARTPDGTVRYPNVAPQTTLEYRNDGASVAEAILLKTAEAPRTVRFHLADPANRLGEAVVRPDGSVGFSGLIDPVTGARLSLGAPRAYTIATPDAPGSGNQAGTAHMRVTRAGDGWDIEQSVDDAWLRGHAFPIVLDPTISVSGPTSAQDCALYSGRYANSSYCNLAYMQAGSVNGGDPNVNLGYVQRSVMRFDTTAIPANAKILDASVYLQNYTATTTTTVSPEELHALQRPFTSTATWNTANGSTAWTTAGGDYDPAVASATSTLPAKPAYTRWANNDAQTTNLRTVVQAWVTTPAANNGLLLRQQAENVNNKYTWFASRTTTGGLPYLQVRFTTPATAPPSVTAVPTDSGATVAWQPSTAPAETEGAITSYLVSAYAAGTTSPVVASTTVRCQRNPQTAQPAVCPTTTLLRGLVNGTSYYATVAAQNTAGAGPATASAAFTPRKAAAFTGLEDWWSFTNFNTGPQGVASVNASNGNLVLQQLDTTNVQAHGALSYTLRRTYNSLDAPLATLPGSIGAGWILNLGDTSDTAGAGITSTAVYVPDGDTAATPQALTLIDRDGTRHLFTPKNAAANRPTLSLVDRNGPSGGAALAALRPKVLQLDTAGYTNLCLDTSYRAPAGVHLGLFRYLAVDSTGSTSPCTAGPNTQPPTVLGFAAIRPDRFRSEYAFDGRLLDQQDGAGNELRYLYDSTPVAGIAMGQLAAVFEPRSCTKADGTPVVVAADIAAACRALRFAYAPTASPRPRPSLTRLAESRPTRSTRSSPAPQATCSPSATPTARPSATPTPASTAPRVAGPRVCSAPPATPAARSPASPTRPGSPDRRPRP